MTIQFMSKLRWAALLTVFISYTAIISGTALAAENGGIGGKPANPRADNPRRLLSMQLTQLCLVAGHLHARKQQMKLKTLVIGLNFPKVTLH